MRSSNGPRNRFAAALAEAEREAEAARREGLEAERAAEAAAPTAAKAGAELAAVNQFLRSSAAATGGASALSDRLEVEPGYELALAAALGPRLAAGVVDDVRSGERALDAAGDDGGVMLVAAAAEAASRGAGAPPAPGAERLLDRVRADDGAVALTARLLADTWVVESLANVPEGFGGVAVTRGGRVWRPGVGELRQAAARRRRADARAPQPPRELVAASEDAAGVEAEARAAVAAAADRVSGADRTREEAEVTLRRALRDVEESAETLRRSEWLIERRREAPDDGP